MVSIGRPLIIAHRGASGTAPENTLASFQKAVDLKADMIELDVHLSRDKQLVVMHDAAVDRTTNGTGRIADLTLAELKTLDAGSWFNKDFSEERVPTLLEVYELLDGGMSVNVEVKVSAKDNREALCAELAEKLIYVLNESKAMELALISSFDIDLLAIISRKCPELPLAYLFDNAPVDLVRWAESGILSAFHPNGRLLAPETITMAKQNGLKTNVWTINEPDDMQRLVKAGVDGLITNFPERWDDKFIS